MVELYYQGVFALSAILIILYMAMWHKHFDVHITLTFVLVNVTNAGYVMFSKAQTLGEAMIANRVTYIGGCYLMMIMMLSVFSLCDIKLKRWIRVSLMVFTTLMYLASLSIGTELKFFYRGVAFERIDGAVVLHKDYGPVHSVFYLMLFAYFAMSIGAMVYSYLKKNQVSRKLIYLLFLPVAVAFMSFFVGRKLVDRIELSPAAFDLALIVYLVISWRMCLYDVNATAADSLSESGEAGFVSFDKQLNYLGSNEQAKKIFPELSDLTVDKPLRGSGLDDTALKWLESFIANENANTVYYDKGEKTYLVNVSYLFDGRRRRGYQLYITDDTANRQYIELLSSFNTELRTEVADKTRHIVEMHDKLILSMATMVESRDNSTGGHIRRTSEVVRMLIDEMKKDPSLRLDESFCRNVIKAAPMHDLGKIAVDDAVLRKPGRFTDEEYEKMKTHAAEGARIVHQILEGTDDEEFRIIAENVAHYHHERWDGSGYPEGLKGTEIPYEARIMAVADVYDALVSKRVYKGKMSFEQADAIITEGMGKHFDKSLEPYYIAARPKLEEYYSAQD